MLSPLASPGQFAALANTFEDHRGDPKIHGGHDQEAGGHAGGYKLQAVGVGD